jgi:DNA integrity scanning protein DisA with diadenylate cyclase activity
MPAHTQTDDSQEIQKLYQLIMSGLEPDLLIENLPLLMGKYRTESETDRAARKERYVTAFAEAFRRIDLVLAEMKKDSTQFRSTVLRKYQQKENESHDDVLRSIDDSLSNS